MADPPAQINSDPTLSRLPAPTRYGPFAVETLFRPADFVSGDIYDVRQLDDQHAGVALADATGHSLPAALLTVYFRRSLYCHETNQLEAPDAVLRRLGNEILAADFAECRFVAVTYATLDTASRQIALARGGNPYPILRRANGALELLQSVGGLVGIVMDAAYAVQTLTLEPGDTLLIYSDGVDTILMPEADRRSPAADHAIVETPWYHLLAEQGPAAALADLAAQHEHLISLGRDLDDLTVIAITCEP